MPLWPTNPRLRPLNVWRAYELLESVSGQPKNELVALVSLIRKVAGIDATLTSYDKTVDRNFQNWVFKKQAGTLKFTEEQMQWLQNAQRPYRRIGFRSVSMIWTTRPLTPRAAKARCGSSSAMRRKILSMN